MQRIELISTWVVALPLYLPSVSQHTCFLHDTYGTISSEATSETIDFTSAPPSYYCEASGEEAQIEGVQ